MGTVAEVDMVRTNIAAFKSQLSEFLQRVEEGESIEVCRRNVPIVRVTPVSKRSGNMTALGCGQGTVAVHTDLTATVLDTWEMNADGLQS
jgi:prevent-host-death family protein